MKEATLLIVILLVFLSPCAYAVCSCSSSQSRSSMTWTISGTFKDVLNESDNSLCVNESVSIQISKLRTEFPLDSVAAQIKYNNTLYNYVKSNASGVLEFKPNNTGVYRIFLSRRSFRDEMFDVIVSSCGIRATTTSTSTPSTTTLENTSAKSTTTSSASTSTSSTIASSTRQVVVTQTNSSTENIILGNNCVYCSTETVLLYFIVPLAAISAVFLYFSGSKKKKVE